MVSDSRPRIDAVTPGSCPFAAGGSGRSLTPEDALVLPMRKRMVVHRTAGEDGAPELSLFYGSKVVSFDEPALFGFGEALATQSRFRAFDATTWGDGQPWSVVAPLLENLLDEGILERASGAVEAPAAPGSMVRPSPLAPSLCQEGRTWAECETITDSLTGRRVEVGHLELIIPIFRIAHPALDADGRQVGEANVFPRALRLDTPTNWVACAYEGTRYMSERPMNVTALKAMRLHWRQMMAALSQIRSAFMRRFPDAEEGWTVGRVERLAALVLAVPTYQLMKPDHPVANAQLHPALSSVFRVTDGLRMAMHQMLFVPIGEPTRSPHDRVSAADIFEYAERNYSFHSETGVCAGPRHMVQEFLRVLLDGEGAALSSTVRFDAPVAAALADVDAAFDYGLLGLRAHAAFFSLWPHMTRAYEQLGSLADRAVASGAVSLTPFRDRLRDCVAGLHTGTYLATEEWRQHREQVYADMFERCGEGLSRPDTSALAPQLAPVVRAEHAEMDRRLRERLGLVFADASPELRAELGQCLLTFFVQAQAIFRAASAVQVHINATLKRPHPSRPFGAHEADVHNLLQGAVVRRMPDLFNEIEHALDVRLEVNTQRMTLADRRNAPASRGVVQQTSAGMSPAV